MKRSVNIDFVNESSKIGLERANVWKEKKKVWKFHLFKSDHEFWGSDFSYQSLDLFAVSEMTYLTLQAVCSCKRLLALLASPWNPSQWIWRGFKPHCLSLCGYLAAPHTAYTGTKDFCILEATPVRKTHFYCPFCSVSRESTVRHIKDEKLHEKCALVSTEFLKFWR